jgi:hypothetical protein
MYIWICKMKLRSHFNDKDAHTIYVTMLPLNILNVTVTTVHLKLTHFNLKWIAYFVKSCHTVTVEFY